MKNIYQCPVCKEILTKAEKNLICTQNHNYDLSADGYVNLLLANQKKTKDPGDSKFMIQNRKYFLELGYYNSLADELSKIINKYVSSNFNILDAGCGEGFYLSKLKNSLQTANLYLNFFGIDISKSAIQKAVKRDKDIVFCIGSTFNLPYLNETLDFIFSIFSPFDPNEFCRVLKQNGFVLVVRPGPSHLKELAQLVYDNFKINELPENEFKESGLELVQKSELKYQINLKSSQEIQSLISMTPYYWHLNKEKEAILATKTELSTQADFQLFLYKKTSL